MASKRCLAIVLPSLSEGVGQLICVSPLRSNHIVANTVEKLSNKERQVRLR